jgi:hypothetical protein
VWGRHIYLRRTAPSQKGMNPALEVVSAPLLIISWIGLSIRRIKPDFSVPWFIAPNVGLGHRASKVAAAMVSQSVDHEP